MASGDYDVVIGLEVHAQLLTKTKMFCGCSTRFGAEANTQTCPVCIGMPGVLPVINRRALMLGLRAAVAFGCNIPERMRFDRKNYYYPDLPKNYQISQNYTCLGTGGHIEIETGAGRKKVRLDNIHLEEDAGKLLHPEGSGESFSRIDLNRAGTPLLELVTEPDMESVEEVEAFMETLRRTLRWLEISDCRMEEGSLRFEASVSLKPAGTPGLGARVEVKNLNSTRAVLNVLEYEIKRQSKALDKGDELSQETRLWDEVGGRSRRMRTKEEAKDYRYFPEPDLGPLLLREEWLDRIRRELPELPNERKWRFEEEYSLPAYDAGVLTQSRDLSDYFEAALEAATKGAGAEGSDAGGKTGTGGAKGETGGQGEAGGAAEKADGTKGEKAGGQKDDETAGREGGAGGNAGHRGEETDHGGAKVEAGGGKGKPGGGKGKPGGAKVGAGGGKIDAGAANRAKLAKEISNWLMGPVLKETNARGCEVAELGVAPEHLAELVSLIDEGTISNNIAQELLPLMIETGEPPGNIARDRGMLQISDSSAVEEIVARVVEENPGPVRDYRGGKKKAIGFLIGQVMREAGGKANPRVVREVLAEKLERE